MKHVLLILFIYMLASCKSAKQETKNQNLETVTVTDMRNLDGCGFLLKTAVMTTCMAGQTITLLYCRKAK